jgi:hypothetical protein
VAGARLGVPGRAEAEVAAEVVGRLAAAAVGREVERLAVQTGVEVFGQRLAVEADDRLAEFPPRADGGQVRLRQVLRRPRLVDLEPVVHLDRVGR